MKQKARFLQESNDIEGIEFPESAYLSAYKSSRHLSPHIVDAVTAFKFVEEYYKKKLDRAKLHHLHKLMMDNLLSEGAGCYRNSRVVVGLDTTPPPAIIPALMEDWISNFNLKGTDPLVNHYAFEAIHPFIDGNGRVGRLLWAWITLRQGGTIEPILKNYPGDTFRERRMAYYQAIRKYRGEHYDNGEVRR